MRAIHKAANPYEDRPLETINLASPARSAPEKTPSLGSERLMSAREREVRTRATLFERSELVARERAERTCPP